ncbi:MAG: hypothetical protein DI533_03495 [Cereibacter sphaeroides]|uniref:VPLPA-CTERM sorting domain-containing protein n=1 Tax=Cereibacter sphaeroides TaxID=1063 RepID=A0A2W5S9P2_CERSP|nr:MAG: hypothetical protein DI533_03495 [Cereibacter sphaeroides]
MTTRMKSLMLLSTAMMLPMAMPAAAACVTAGVDVTCAGTVDVGFTNNANGVRVTVEADATVSRDNGDAVRVRGTGSRVTNNGTISGEQPIEGGGSDGIDGGHGLIVTNNGKITATNKGIDADEKNDLYVTNNGTIYAYDKAIRNGDGLRGSLRNEGTIESETDEGFESGNEAWVLNTGTIRASDDAIQVGENASIFNYGLIESVRRGGDENDPQDGIDLDSGVVSNYYGAVIRSDDDAAIDFDESVITSTINNYGTIEGTVGVLTDPANTASQIIYNYGSMTGTSGIAVDLGFGNDELRLYNGSKLNGDALLGDGDDTAYFGAGIANSLMNSIINGGAGSDTAIFAGLEFASLLGVKLFGQIMTLSLFNDISDYSVSFVAFDTFRFTDGDYSWDQVAQLTPPAPVPLPAAGMLMVPALGALAMLRRRRR